MCMQKLKCTFGSESLFAAEHSQGALAREAEFCADRVLLASFSAVLDLLCQELESLSLQARMIGDIYFVAGPRHSEHGSALWVRGRV